MYTRNGLTDRLLHAVAIRPAVPGLVVVAGLLVVAVSGLTVTSAPWFWPACAVLVVLAVVIDTARQDFWRRVETGRHEQRMTTANALLNDQASAGPEGEITGSIRELGGAVERFGRRLDELLAEVHAETRSAGQKARRA